MNFDKLKDRVKELRYKFNSNKENLIKTEEKLKEYGITDLNNIDNVIKDIKIEIDELESKEKKYFSQATTMLDKMDNEE